MKEKIIRAIIFVLLAGFQMAATGQEKCIDVVEKINARNELNIDARKVVTILKSLDETGILPKNYVTENYARENCDWEPGKKLWGINPCNKKILGGDRFTEKNKLLPFSKQWRTADIDYSGRERKPERLLYVPGTKIRYITPDEYKSFMPISECSTDD